jgi:predicted DNA-binding protein
MYQSIYLGIYCFIWNQIPLGDPEGATKAGIMKTTLARSAKKKKFAGNSAGNKSGASRAPKERVLIEFPSSLLRRTEEAARKLDKNRSELIRAAVEQYLNEMETAKFEQELAASYAANADRNRALAEEFKHVDREGF